MTDAPVSDVDERSDELLAFNFTASAAVALLVGVLLAVTARTSATALLVAVAVVQALVATAVLYGLQVPGRKGGTVLAALAAAGADVAVSVWPHSHLGTLLPVLGLALPALIAHQLLRGAARERVIQSLGGIALSVVLVVAAPALLQLRHEITDPSINGRVVFGCVSAIATALVVGYLADLVVAAPRFDRQTPRGLVAVLVATLTGAAVGYLALRDVATFAGGRGLFLGAALGVLAALLSVGVAMAEVSEPAVTSGFARRCRPTLGAVVPLCLLAPVAFLLCVAIRG